NGTAQRAPVIMIVVGRPLGREKVVCIEPVVVSEIEGCAVEGVSTALESHIYGRPTLYAVFSGGQLLDRIFPDRVVAKKRGWNPQESGLADKLVAVKAVVIRHTVNHVVVGGRALSVDAHVHKASARRTLHTGRKAQDGLKITALSRQIHDGF